MSRAVEAARELLHVTRPPVEQWKREREIREHTSSEVDVPSRREFIVRQLDELKDSDYEFEQDVEKLVELVLEWPEDQLDSVRERVQDLANTVVTSGGEGSGEEV